MPEYEHRSDRDLIDILDEIEKSPHVFVPTARDDVTAVLARRYPRLTPADIKGRLEAAEVRQEKRRSWIEAYAADLCRHGVYPPEASPDAAAVHDALEMAIKSARFDAFIEVLLVSCIPFSVALGLIQILDPDALVLQPFEALKRLPFLKYIGYIPQVIAQCLLFAFSFFETNVAVKVIAVTFGGATLLGIHHVIGKFRWVSHLRTLRARHALLAQRSPAS